MREEGSFIESQEWKSKSSSSFRQSVDLSDSNIGGEDSHKMNDLYFKPIKPKNFSNPLYLEEKSSRPQESVLVERIPSGEDSDQLVENDEWDAPDKSDGDLQFYAEDKQEADLNLRANSIESVDKK